MISDKASSFGVNTSVAPSGDGCVECLQDGGWWLHLRRCAECGHVGCCDMSPAQHATAHFHESAHPLMQSFEPGENWFYDYRCEQYCDGPELAWPHSHPTRQAVPGPQWRVPEDWRAQLHQ